MSRRPSAKKLKSLRETADLLRVLGHPTRLAIVEKLSKGPKCVTDIQELLDVPQANVSQHLAVLRSHQIVGYYEEGKLRCYYLTRPGIAAAVREFLGSSFPVVERSREQVRRAGSRVKANGTCEA